MRGRTKTADMEGILSKVLVAGVLVSFALIVAGLGYAYATGGASGLDAHIVSGTFFAFAGEQVLEVLSGSVTPRSLVGLGILVLMLTPYVRVLSSVLLFGLRERDAKFTLITLFVLVVLTLALGLL